MATLMNAVALVVALGVALAVVDARHFAVRHLHTRRLAVARRALRAPRPIIVDLAGARRLNVSHDACARR